MEQLKTPDLMHSLLLLCADQSPTLVPADQIIIKGGLIMALCKCPDCEKNISDLACACIHCGKPMIPASLHTDSEATEVYPRAEFISQQGNNEAQDTIKLSPRGILLSVLMLLSACATGFVLWSTSSSGTGITPDSVYYISCARNLAAGKGYTVLCGYKYMAWPPLFPTLLAALNLVGFDPLDGARFLNAVICGFIVFCSGLLFIKTLQNSYLLVFGFLLVLFSSPLLYVSSHAWTEPLFIVLTVLFVLNLAQFLRNAQWSSFILFSCCAALACLERYIGVTLVLTGSAAILFFMNQCSILKRIKYAALFAGIALAPIAVWCIRNYSLNSTLTGGRNAASTPAIWNAWLCIKTFAEWFIPDILPPSLTQPVVFINLVSGIIIISIFFRLKAANVSRPSAKVLIASYSCIVIFLFFLFKNLALWIIPHHVPSFMAIPFLINAVLGVTIIALFFLLRQRHAVHTAAKELLIAYSFIVIYVSFLVYSASTVGFDNIDTRLLCPVYMFLVYAALAAGDRLAALAGVKQKKYAWAVFMLLTVWFISWPCRTSLSTMAQQYNSGTIFSNTQLKQLPLLEWLRRNPLDGTIYSNAPLLLYIQTGIEAYDSTDKPHDLIHGLKKSPPPTKAIYLIWLTKNPQGVLYTHDEIASQLSFDLVKGFPEGAVLRLRQ
jgi:hypothetical protein